MIIKRITVKSFGSVKLFETELTPGLNILDTLYTPLISTAIELVLCSKTVPKFESIGVSGDTLITAEVLLGGSICFVELKPLNGEELELTASDVDGNDVTDLYRGAMSHCREQDAAENFDGRDKSLPLRLYWYLNSGIQNDLAVRTNYMTETRTFRSRLMRYIKAFEAESINNQEKYKASINKDGRFEVVYPDASVEIPLSETEEKLFLYVCFLNVAEFWEDVENIRDMHHEKKPLLIKGFLEFLDETADIHGLISRTVNMRRQVILLTPPMDKQAKNKWNSACCSPICPTGT